MEEKRHAVDRETLLVQCTRLETLSILSGVDRHNMDMGEDIMCFCLLSMSSQMMNNGCEREEDCGHSTDSQQMKTGVVYNMEYLLIEMI